MYTRMRSKESLYDVLQYHERKVTRGQAECLYAGNFLKDAPELTQQEKLFHFERLNVLNQIVRRKTVHILLSWPPEDRMDNEKMCRIAKDFMRDTVYWEQPYLVYRHRDTVNPHAHIVSTNIRANGSKIEHTLACIRHGWDLSRRLEKEYGLYQSGQLLPEEEWRRRHPVQKVVYGQTPLKPAMTRVLETVLPAYNYTSLEELNVILRQYNMAATRGKEDSATRRKHGLHYMPLDGNGRGQQVYIKSSAFRCLATLKYLEGRYVSNDLLRNGARQRLTTVVDWIFFKQQVSEEALRAALEKEKISMYWEGGKVYYLDELHKAVFDGEQLGRGYSAEGIRERVIPEEVYRQRQTQQVRVPRLRQRQGPELY